MAAGQPERAYVRVIYRGRVQGVGFRYTTLQVAKGYEVTGFVRNETDGSVWLEAEGEAPEVAAFADAVAEELADFIREVDRVEGMRSPRFTSGFIIR